MELCRDPLVGGEVTLEDGHAKIDGNEVLSMDNIPLYNKNETLQQLLTQKHKLEDEFVALATRTDNEAINLRLANSEKRNKIAEQLHALEMDVLGLYKAVSEKRQLGQTLNWREKKAIELVDAGHYEGAKQILRDKTWKQEIQQSEALIDNLTERIREYISGQNTLIQTICSTGITVESEQEIISIYEDITALAQKYQIELDTLYKYAVFLNRQNRFIEGIRVAETLRKLYALNCNIDDYKKAELLQLLGVLYKNQTDYTKAEAMYRETLEIYHRITAENSVYHKLCVARAYSALADLLTDTNQYEEAEPLYRDALEIYLRLEAENPNAYESYVAESYNDLAILLKKTVNYAEAEPLYRKALEIRRRLAGQNPGAHEPDMAYTCNNLANLLENTGHYAEAESLHQEALKIFRRLAVQNPTAYEPSVADTCNNLAVFFSKTGHYVEAEPLYKEALEIRRRLAARNPEAYEPDVADTCNNLANLLQSTEHPAEAEPLYDEALEIRRKLAVRNPKAYELDVAQTCYNFAIFQLNIKKDPTAANVLFKETLSVYEKYPHLREQASMIRHILV
jgi:tetratricopeptide (TPR) repeat protein